MCGFPGSAFAVEALGRLANFYCTHKQHDLALARADEFLAAHADSHHIGGALLGVGMSLAHLGRDEEARAVLLLLNQDERRRTTDRQRAWGVLERIERGAYKAQGDANG